MNKYKLTENKKEIFGTTLYQIKALKDFSNVSKGDLGGWIEKESNLSQLNNAWVCGNAWVCDDACVYGNALVSGNEKVMGSRTEKENIKYSNKQLQETKQLNNSSDNIKTNKEKISMLQSLTNALKRNLSPASQKLYKAGLINGGLELTEKGSEELNDVLYAKHEKELVERAEEIIAEEKKKK